MYLKCSQRRKNGKEHRSWSIVESRRVQGGQRVQRHVLYLGEINDSQQAAWQKSIAVFPEGEREPQQVALFPEDRVGAAGSVPQIQLKLSALSLHRPRQWGACWLALELWRELGLDAFWRERLAESRKGTRWDLVLTTLAIYRWLDPGSEWRLHREWFERNALGDLLGGDYRLVADDTLYRCHDLLLAHKAALFTHLQERWRDLFHAKCDVLLSDLTSTYFESDPPENKDGLRRFGYSRDKRSDGVQVIIALIVTPEGFPLGYEVLRGNTADNTTLKAMREKIESQYGPAERTWLMDRGIPTEEDELLMKLGAAKAETGQCWRAVEITLPEPPAKIARKAKKPKPALVTFQLRLDRARLRQRYRREGRYLLRSNLTETDPAALWQHYITLTQIEEAFKNLEGDLGVRPIFHQKDDRIEAHIFVAFQADCLHVTLGRRLHALAPGLTARAVLEKFTSISLLDVQLPTTDGRTLHLARYTQPDPDTQLLLAKLKLELPPQAPPKITAPAAQ